MLHTTLKTILKAAMELLLSIPTTTLLAIFVVSFLTLTTRLYGKISKADQKNKAAPEAAGAWPVIGHLHLLGGPELPHKTLGAMADKFGPIFTIKLGLNRALVVSDSEMAKECFTTNDAVFANRPKSIAVELMGYNYAMFGFGPYGPYWRQVRKIVMLELLSNRRLELLGHIRRSEVKTSVRDIYELWLKNKRESGSDKVVVEMKKWFGDLALNLIVRIVSGRRYSGEDEEESVRFQKAIREFFELIGLFLVADSLPFLRWLDLGGYQKDMKRTAKDLDSILQKWLDEHKQKRISGEVKGEQDFMDVMLSILEGDAADEDQPRYDADTINKSTCLVAFAAGTDTTTVTLTWALSLLLNNRHTLEAAQKELDLHIGKARQVEESDLKNLVYLQAIIKETMRLYPAGPLLVPRESMEDCTVGGYRVPKGTRLLVNASKIQRDPKIWSNPDEFRPERFLTTHKEIDARGHDFELIPFGSGRRICPGISFSLQIIQLTLANLLHRFELSTLSDGPIDMSEGMGLTNLKVTPLEVFLTPRLSSTLFE